jgi:5,5'-dehydrodivanillate O-demethylase
MLTAEENARLSQVGPGTPMGDLLGEDLALYRTDDGKLGLVAARCAHRGASLVYGIPEEDGIRCPYHGWKYDATGQCTEQPAEPEGSTFYQRVCIPAYPVQELGGFLWAYLGPAPAPLLPRYDLLVLENLEREIGWTELPCNWLQIMENSMDPVHLEYLHSRFFNYMLRKQGKPPAVTQRRHQKIGFDVFDFGITKRRLLDGESEDAEGWRVGHPVLWPNILALGGTNGPRFEIRVPEDDTHTRVFHYFTKPVPPGTPPQAEIPVFEIPFKQANGVLVLDTVLGQDMMAWVTQGDVADRTAERLGASDKGVILLRQVLEEQLAKVARGEDPMAVVRDPAQNVCIRVPREDDAFFTHTGGMMGETVDDRLGMIRRKGAPQEV